MIAVVPFAGGEVKAVLTVHGHLHREAFCLMQYEADDGSECVTIWNSRDGVTPFCCTLPSGKPGRHVRWGEDVYAPEHQPAAGDLVWADVFHGLDRWQAIYRARIESYAAAHPESVGTGITPDEGPDRDALVDHLAKAQMREDGEQGTVSLVVWDEKPVDQ